VKVAVQVSLSARRRRRNSRKACANYWLGRGSLSGTSRRCFLRRRKKQICRHSETGTQTLHHRHAQPLFATHYFTHAAWGAEERDKVRSRETVLIHEVADQIGDAGRPARPLLFLVRSDQARLRLQPSDLGWIIRIPKLIDERAGAYKLAITIDQNEGRIHHTVSASILSYSACIPKNRIAKKYYMLAVFIAAASLMIIRHLLSAVIALTAQIRRR
jgi:hypothetical protein